jgi:hypothetical protein
VLLPAYLLLRMRFHMLQEFLPVCQKLHKLFRKQKLVLLQPSWSIQINLRVP